ncbi:MGH1-like glycoside hydrolase domain-containing protein [Chitinophaga sancti]|uniref:Glycoside hydrolase n=1 Tax=Chitinophaga sancti TaxID=1004 RepID=A0A1K1PXV8_9BACT|nr:glycoside hydrolase [Chitinophaga sancti]WQD61521.1 glycoside hydrolase [Chitinophaga sancti]WQG92922.1 glycoside hydrolase [Chitinophaga sancti]SFW52341.1 hypothetical protein SAMN05661012_02349 [Chitinophaga sancti]
MGSKRTSLIFVIFVLLGVNAYSQRTLKDYVNQFNAADSETAQNYVNNAQAYEWLNKNIPLLECPDTIIEKIYYYRWWTFRKHLKETPDGFIFTEFILPVKHAGRYNALSCALGHHINEGRWLRDTQYINQDIRYWFMADAQQKTPKFHQFSSWAEWAVLENIKVHGDPGMAVQLLPYMDADYHLWEKEKRLPGGLFWQFDVKDGMEESISGSRKEKHIRPTINSYMYGNALAMAAMAQVAGNDSLVKSYTADADKIKSLAEDSMWDRTASFFKVRLAKGGLSDAREEIGFIPWYFNLPADKPMYARAWQQLTDTAGFNAPWGITTAERRHPLFRSHGTGGCEWDGALWPFATTQTLKALSNLLRDYRHKGGMTPAIYYEMLRTYARSHQKNGAPYLGEYQDEKNGYWLKGDNPRSSYYNHSGFCDLVINDLVGIRPSLDNKLTIDPMLPWKWFQLSNIPYHGHLITVSWNYRKAGFYIYVDNAEKYHGKQLKAVTLTL